MPKQKRDTVGLNDATKGVPSEEDTRAREGATGYPQSSSRSCRERLVQRMVIKAMDLWVRAELEHSREHHGVVGSGQRKVPRRSDQRTSARNSISILHCKPHDNRRSSAIEQKMAQACARPERGRSGSRLLGRPLTFGCTSQ